VAVGSLRFEMICRRRDVALFSSLAPHLRARQRMSTNSNYVTVFLGDALDVPSERHFLERLRRDLSDLPTLIVANFFPEGARQPRQIDFLVRTGNRTMHVELKALNEARPIRGAANGDWVQSNSAGDNRAIGNPFRQAHFGTYAISDSLATFARRTSGIPAATYRDLETVVCIYPSIPAGSQIGPYNHVDVVDYEELVHRLRCPGRNLPWAPDHWDGYIRHLAVYRERDESAEARLVRVAAAEVADYRSRFGDRHATDLHELVSLPATIDGQETAPMDTVERVAVGDAVVIVGASGLGKTFTAKHAAISLTKRESTVIWARADEYDERGLSALLTRSVAPYTVHTAAELVRNTEQSGSSVVLIIDGFTGGNRESRLIEQLAAFRLRHPAGLILTSTVPLATNSLAGIAMNLGLPDTAGRAALLESYGVRADGTTVDALSTPFEIATLAAVRAHLPAGVTPILVHDAYIGERTRSETVRAGLRALAIAMVTEIRSSLLRVDARAILQRSADLGPACVDDVLANSLLEVGQNRIRFGHDLHARFLAAEHLVLSSATGEDLGRQLARPRYRDLAVDALALEQDAGRVSDALSVLADPDLYAAAAGGELGPVAASQVKGEIESVLIEATGNTNRDTVMFSTDQNDVAGTLGDEWTSTRRWSAREVALLTAAGTRLWFGDLVDEVGALLDRTDLVCHATMRDLQASGHRRPITSVVAATYSGVSYPGRECIPGTIVVQACHQAAWQLRRDRRPRVATCLAEKAGSRSWGRLYVALEVLDPDIESTLMVELLSRAWDAGGYHLRLHALYTAMKSLGAVDDTTREQVADLLETFDDDGSIGLSTTLVEALSAAGRIHSERTLADVRAEIADVLSEHDVDSCNAAASIYSNQFEDDIIGPYAEAVGSLDNVDRKTLLIMAASAEHTFWLHLILQELTTHLPTDDSRIIEVFRRHATRFPSDRVMVDDAVHTYLTAVRGWAQIDDALPAAGDLDADERAWQLIGHLILRHERGAKADGDTVETWRLLLGEYAHAAIDPLRCSTWHRGDGDARNYVAALHDTYPNEFVALMEWGLTHRTELTSVFPGSFGAASNTDFLFSMLGRYGTANTIGLLSPYVDDPALGRCAVDAIREIETRDDRSVA
jgi:Nuclease-related domain